MSDFTREHRQDSATPTVLLIETCEADARQFEKHLRRVALHWKVTTVKDGFIAVQRMILEGFPTLLVTCVQTPRFGAVDIAEWIQSVKTPVPVPIAIHDEALPAEIGSQLRQYGVTDLLDKSASAQDFQKQLLRLVKRIELEGAVLIET